MGRIKKKRYGLFYGAVTLGFSVLITAIFVGGLLWFLGYANKASVSDEDVYIIAQTDYRQILQNKRLNVDTGRIVNGNDYGQQYKDELVSVVFKMALLSLILLFAAFCGLLFMQRRIRNRELLYIAEQMAAAASRETVAVEPVLQAAYNKLRASFEEQLRDYKRLSSYLSHEQKNELAIVRARLELLGQKDSLKNIDAIIDGIDDILTLSENMGSSALSEVDVCMVCAEVCDRYRELYGGISFDFEKGEDAVIEAKQRWIYRAVANLVDNAVKYGEGNPIHVSVAARHGSVIVAVQDQGIGIGEERQDAVFDNLYRVNELNRDGYGIGLSLVSHVCNLCGGFVNVESGEGKGTVFYLSFPKK